MSLPLWLSVGVCLHMRVDICLCVCFNLLEEQNQADVGGGEKKNGEVNTSTCSRYKPRTTRCPKHMNVTFYFSWNNATELESFTKKQHIKQPAEKGCSLPDPDLEPPGQNRLSTRTGQDLNGTNSGPV